MFTRANMDDSRVKAFRALKPPCVDLSQVVLKYKAKKATAKEIINSLENLYKTLRTLSKPPNALDSKLADYAFFPLTHIFRDIKDLPIQVVEIALQCLQLLISKGWGVQISPDMGRQLLILLCFIAGGSATEAKVKNVNEELGAAAFECLASLFDVSQTAGMATKGAIVSENIPILGHTVTVMLDGITDGPSVKVRLAALAAIDNTIDGIHDEAALKNVFPGIVSSLTKVLSSKGQSKPSFGILSSGLGTLGKVLYRVIGDDVVFDSKKTSQDTGVVSQLQKTPSNPWLQATSSQVKMALANIMPLRYHERSEVLSALSHLCISILQKCRKSLHQSIPMVVDTLGVLYSRASETDAAFTFNISSIFSTDTGLLEILKGSLHDLIVALPRIMQSNDDRKKQRTIDQISTSLKIFESQNINLDVVNDLMASNLTASVSTAIQACPSKAIESASEGSLEITRILNSAGARSPSIVFDPVLFRDPSIKTTILALQKLANHLEALPMSSGLQQGIVAGLRTTQGDEQLAKLWITLQLINNTSSQQQEMGQYLNPQSGQISQQPLLNDAYAFSLDVLSGSTFSSSSSWKLQALALETLSLQALSQKYDFRPELVDALYPILERLGSPNAALQQHALTALNIVSEACEYTSPAALVIDNADYLTNAVALKLNTFDISPQAPQVLVMMVRLCGAALIPYLDDLVESIFSILACYHGYPKLVESLFSVLNAIVEEAGKTTKPAIEKAKSNDHTITHPQPYHPTTIEELADLLKSNYKRAVRPPSPPPSPTAHPSKPFETLKEHTSEEPDFEDPSPEEANPNSTNPDQPNSILQQEPPPPSKTTAILTSITSLTPSHLATPSLPLRVSLLTLLSKSLPVLAHNPETFLPIAASLYPSITTRLRDPSPHTIAAAARALAVLCECAGDFLASRVRDDWMGFTTVLVRCEKEMLAEVRGRGKAGGRGTWWRAWDALVGLICSVLREVGGGEEMEDQVFEILVGKEETMENERMEEVRGVLEWLNADLFWLVEERRRAERGGEKLGTPDRVGKWEFKELIY